MAHKEMTIADVLKDPLIRQMMRADGVTVRYLRRLLHEKMSMTREPHASRTSR